MAIRPQSLLAGHVVASVARNLASAGLAIGVARNQPVTAVIDAVRTLLSGHAPGADAVAAVAWSLGVIVASVAAAGMLFARRAR